MGDCPNCEIGKLQNGRCPRCDWQAPKAEPVPKVIPTWEMPGSMRDVEPLTEEQRAALRQALDGLYAKFGVPVEKLRKFTLAGVATRCSQCANGKFVHGGVRYCAACYGKL